MHSKKSDERDDWKHGFHEGVARVGCGRPTLQRAPTPAWESGRWRSKARTEGMARASTRPGRRELDRQPRRPAQEKPDGDRLPPRSGTIRARWLESLESAERCPARRVAHTLRCGCRETTGRACNPHVKAGQVDPLPRWPAHEATVPWQKQPPCGSSGWLVTHVESGRRPTFRNGPGVMGPSGSSCLPLPA